MQLLREMNNMDTDNLSLKFALFINNNLIGKTIKDCCVFDNQTPVQEVRRFKYGI